MQELEKKNKELLEEIEKLKRQNKFLKSRKKYGLVWEEEKEPEKIVQDCQIKIPILKEVKTKKINKSLKEFILQFILLLIFLFLLFFFFKLNFLFFFNSFTSFINIALHFI